MTPQKIKALINFKKTKGLMDKIIAMTESGTYCIDIMQQNLAAIGLLRSAHELLMEGHLGSCFSVAIESKNTQKQKAMTAEILKVTKLFNK
jgi:CsoR family transcriptional regulator, copper-sensing transcriptional repressor